MTLWTDTLGAELRSHQAGREFMSNPSAPTRRSPRCWRTARSTRCTPPRVPRTFNDGTGRVRRLFEPSSTAEVGYFQRTKIFPIMHVVVLRRDVYERNRWLAKSLFDAFSESKVLAEQDFTETAALRYMLPWLLDEVDRTKQILGDDF